MSKKKHPTAIGLPMSDKIMHAVVMFFMILLVVVIMYPLIFILSSSFSSGFAVSTGRVILWPVEPSVEGYKYVFNYQKVWTAYGNTIFYTVLGTCLNLFLTVITAYPLSRKNFQGRGFYLTVFMITMFFGGGMIPTYILMSRIGLTNSRWTLILMGGISVYNMIVMRSFFSSSIPNDLFDAARIDGASDIGYLLKIVIPLSKAVFAVIILYYAVGHWNQYFNAMLYLRKEELYPLQLVLRDILKAATIKPTDDMSAEDIEAMRGMSDLLKYALIVISSAPILCAYQFVQKFFEKGVMIGSVKG